MSPSDAPEVPAPPLDRDAPATAEESADPSVAQESAAEESVAEGSAGRAAAKSAPEDFAEDSAAESGDDEDEKSIMSLPDDAPDATMAKELLDWLFSMTPSETVAELDKYIVGQADAKKAVAVALRNRWRRQKVRDEALREEIFPNNLIMIGPTGVGKTEIARRMARLSASPFVKVEASKFTEVGYVGRDVESMVRDLADTAVNMLRNEREEQLAPEASRRTEERLLDLLLPDSAERPRKRPARTADPAHESIEAAERGADEDGPAKSDSHEDEQDMPDDVAFLAGKDGVSRPALSSADQEAPAPASADSAPSAEKDASTSEDPLDSDDPLASAEDPSDPPAEVPTTRLARTREKLRALLKKGELEERVVEMEIRQSPAFLDAMTSPGGRMEDVDTNFTETLRDIFPKRTKQRSVTIAEARRIIFSDELDLLVDSQDIVFDAMDRVEESGIIFLDEIDKIAAPQRGSGPDVSREGVQRDLLPIVEGCNVHTKYGMISTEHILFIAAGAFHVAKPSDLIPELQGRFPIRVELKSLNANDFVRILKEPRNSLVRQYAALIRVEGIVVTFTDDALEEVARIAAELNDRMENIGARRLQTVLISVMEQMMFELPEGGIDDVEVDAAFVRDRLQPVVSDSDLSRYIL